jgi:hypothetical protein
MDTLLLSCLPFALPMWYRLEWAQCHRRRCRSSVRCADLLAFPWLAGIFFSLKAKGLVIIWGIASVNGIVKEKGSSRSYCPAGNDNHFVIAEV